MAAADRHRPRKHSGLDACPAADPSSGRRHAAVLQTAQSAGFAVAGGAALIEQGLIQRQTRDVDLFLLDAAASTITSAAASFETAIGERGWSHQRVIDQSDVRLQITGSAESLIVDLGRDSPAEEPIDATDLGPTLSVRDLAARKTLALFGRAEARDFTDVYDLARRFGRDQLLDWAAEDDPGFDNQIFADMSGAPPVRSRTPLCLRGMKPHGALILSFPRKIDSSPQ